MCNAYEKWIERRAATLSETSKIYDLEWTFYESLLQSCIEMGAYIIMVTLCTIVAGSETVSTTMFMQGSLAGFYGKIVDLELDKLEGMRSGQGGGAGLVSATKNRSEQLIF